jgi:hypothetical protein
MDRRRFLAGLFASGVVASAAPVLIEEVSRVYSFPQQIVCVNSLQRCLVVFYDHNFVEKLRINTPMLRMKESHIIGSHANGFKMFQYIPTQVELAT